MEPITIITISSAIILWLKYAREDKKIRNDELKRIMDAYLAAITETKSYIKSNKRTKLRDENRELKIAQLWNSVSSVIMPYNSDLGERCMIKAGYWTNPESWTDSKITGNGIRLGQIERDVKKIIELLTNSPN